MRAIVCVGTRYDSKFCSSLSAKRLERLCEEHDLVVNERHHIDIVERNMTCTWDVVITNPSHASAVRSVLESTLLPETIKTTSAADVQLAGSYTVFSCYLHGEDDPGTRPPEWMQETITRLCELLETAGFVVTIDTAPLERLAA